MEWETIIEYTAQFLSTKGMSSNQQSMIPGRTRDSSQHVEDEGKGEGDRRGAGKRIDLLINQGFADSKGPCSSCALPGEQGAVCYLHGMDGSWGVGGYPHNVRTMAAPKLC